MSNRAAEYRTLVEDVTAVPWLLEDDERMEIRDMLARVERKILAGLPTPHAEESAA